MIIIISLYEQMPLAHLKWILRKGYVRVWEFVQQDRTAESHTCHTHRGVCLTYLMLDHDFKNACNVSFSTRITLLCLF